jgi:NAD(P)-dependent dehydrogenase (short-subunit alcohol dehydrogenase family)
MGMRVVITGAGSGLGQALALRYAAAGARVACTDRDLSSAEHTLALLTAEGGSGLAVALDVTDEASLSQLATRLERDWGGIDVLINNAGVAVSGGIDETPLADWQWVLDVNVLGVVRGCKAFVPMLRAQRSGQIINIASFAAIANPPGMAAYNVAKAGVVALSETLRLELAADGIAISVVCPAFFPTNLMVSARVAQPATVGLVQKMMKKSGVTAEQVAEQIFTGAQRKQFLLLTHRDTRVQAAIKRASPELFFRLMQKATAKMFRRS